MPPPTTMTSGGRGCWVVMSASSSEPGGERRAGPPSAAVTPACRRGRRATPTRSASVARRRRARRRRAWRGCPSRSASRKSAGRSAKVMPVPRSTAWTITSRARIHGISVAGTVRPWAVTDLALPLVRRRAVASRSSAAAAWRDQARSVAGGRVAPSSMSAARCSGEAYIGVSRRRWPPSARGCERRRRWRRGGRPGARGSSRAARTARRAAASVSPATATCDEAGALLDPAAGCRRACAGRRAGHDGSSTTTFSSRPMPSISVTTVSPADEVDARACGRGRRRRGCRWR